MVQPQEVLHELRHRAYPLSTFSGLRFATLRATCDTDGRLLLFTVGSGLKDNVEWDFYVASGYEVFDDYGARYIDPMLQSLNIYTNPGR